MKIVGVVLQRNELDVILFNVLHHLGPVGLDEIIVGDNGSTDGSLAALKLLESEETRLTVISMPGPFLQRRNVSTPTWAASTSSGLAKWSRPRWPASTSR